MESAVILIARLVHRGRIAAFVLRSELPRERQIQLVRLTACGAAIVTFSCLISLGIAVSFVSMEPVFGRNSPWEVTLKLVGPVLSFPAIVFCDCLVAVPWLVSTVLRHDISLLTYQVDKTRAALTARDHDALSAALTNVHSRLRLTRMRMYQASSEIMVAWTVPLAGFTLVVATLYVALGIDLVNSEDELASVPFVTWALLGYTVYVHFCLLLIVYLISRVASKRYSNEMAMQQLALDIAIFNTTGDPRLSAQCSVLLHAAESLRSFFGITVGSLVVSRRHLGSMVYTSLLAGFTLVQLLLNNRS
ncbi:uncharacterized protein AMSG_08149 [Thecamonas trahens ATCC 50062]|uniref:Uncharacterized protein n=1 Tax=Thecamonas trahens ATCC 50062 TaxID=461836 RepID=A0A0L0DKM6_THETB|nr:hypothetical protein AMSG_08149 [Thecamonas trahens ATCC 50062]KNC51913.1 hypothetical protein AMSG_08149 [Thecamonas trahens ATCC 50062]|eukprot:XP_013755510.1 hypothetical protein AMSG_08149 [Thecamonas trahens ATCC 50062]